MSNAIDKVLRADSCAGCGLCESITGGKVKVELSDRGYYRPSKEAQLSRRETELVRSACPAISVQHSVGGGRSDPLWGPVIESGTGHASDPDIRYQGSSGGLLTALQVYLLNAGDVDAVISVGACSDAPLLNRVYVCKTAEEILSNVGSRYAPSAPLKDIHQLVEDLDCVAFVGKPCDVSALRRLAAVDPALKPKKFYFLSFFCAGVPSQNATNTLVEAMGYQPEEITKFRYRGEGWPGFAKAEATNGSSARMSYSESWGTILNRQLQTRCKICPDGTGEHADIACGDAWYGDEKGYPKFKEMDGRSAVLVRTKKGKALVDDALREGQIHLEVDLLSLSDLSSIQPYQVNRRQMLLSRTIAFAAFKRSFVKFAFWPALKAGSMISLPRKIMEFVRTVNRLLKRRL